MATGLRQTASAVAAEAASADRKGHLNEQAYMIFDHLYGSCEDATAGGPYYQSAPTPMLAAHTAAAGTFTSGRGAPRAAPSTAGSMSAGPSASAVDGSSTSQLALQQLRREEGSAAAMDAPAQPPTDPSVAAAAPAPAAATGVAASSIPFRTGVRSARRGGVNTSTQSDVAAAANDDAVVAHFAGECPVAEGNIFPTSGVSSPIGEDSGSPLNASIHHLEDIPFPASGSKPTRDGPGRSDDEPDHDGDVDGRVQSLSTIANRATRRSTLAAAAAAAAAAPAPATATALLSKRKRVVGGLKSGPEDVSRVDAGDGSTLLDQSLDALSDVNNSAATTSVRAGRSTRAVAQAQEQAAQQAADAPGAKRRRVATEALAEEPAKGSAKENAGAARRVTTRSK